MDGITDRRAVQMMGFLARAVMVLVGTVAWFGLAVWIFGGAQAFFAHEALIALAVVQVLMSVAALFAGGNLSRGVKYDRGDRWVLATLIVIQIALGLVPPWTDRLGVWCLDGETVRWLGVALVAIGSALRLWPVYVLGHRFSGFVAIQPGHQLLTTGLYSVIRHPSYLGLLTISAGWSLAFRSIAGLLLTALSFVILLRRIAAEERLLSQQFGTDYESWRARTARMIPGVW
jgi:protein-S-isoprenylcysteine O-methyltransferase Ste14